MNGLITLKILKEETLQEKKFHIPSYQRGYRWQAKQEVKDLLEDLLEFFESTQNTGDGFYCLQPLVVKGNGEKFIVLDGQQRLTTFFLIYKCLFSNSNMFEIEYETRAGSGVFLQEIEHQLEARKNENIDFFHIYEAYISIKTWFEDNTKKELFRKYFLEKAKVIWYEVDKSEKEIDIFLRLNIGKIPLTNAELIKALFMSKSKGANNDTLVEDNDILKERAKLWYECEKKTRADNDKAYCLFNNPLPEDIVENDKLEVNELNDDISRIEMYFEALREGETLSSSPNALFKYYNDLLKSKPKDKIWNDLDECQLSLLGIARPSDHEGRKLYHYLGFLILHNKYSAKELLGEIKRMELSGIVETLYSIIHKKYKNTLLQDLNYTEHRQKLNELLLLFNLEDSNQNTADNRDFEFNRFKMDKWSLEHIIPQRLKNETEFEIVNAWIWDIRNLSDPQKVEQIEVLQEKLKSANQSNDTKKFAMVVEEIKTFIDENAEDIHSISNLVLLDRTSNARLSNANFATKREGINILFTSNKLIPQCTGYVFNKKYSTDQGEPSLWTYKDRDAYQTELQKILKDFVKGEENE